ncbi:MAG: thioredoxin [Hyphomicrobiales bacterium]|nr:thioredoxin [Hyphomicrobiales bacterium]
MTSTDDDLIGGGSAGQDLIKDTSTDAFMADVIEASKEAVVLVDFWAPWCGPCKQLTPVLEASVKAAGGAARLVKLNIDEHPAIPGQMGIQSIPAVFAFKDGKPVDGFTGAITESQIKSFISKLLGPDAGGADDGLLDAANDALEAGDFASAAELFAGLLQKDGTHVEAIGGLAKCYVKAGELERAEETLALAPPDKADAAAVSAARAMLDLARKSGDTGDIESLRAAVAADGSDLQARFDLAIALNAAGERDGAVDELMAIMATDRAWNDDGARTQLLQLFEAWGPGDPATVAGRQKLSSLLFS